MADDLAYQVAYQGVAYSFLVVEEHQGEGGLPDVVGHFVVLEEHQVVVVVHQVSAVQFVVSFPSLDVGSYLVVVREAYWAELRVVHQFHLHLVDQVVQV